MYRNGCSTLAPPIGAALGLEQGVRASFRARLNGAGMAVLGSGAGAGSQAGEDNRGPGRFCGSVDVSGRGAVRQAMAGNRASELGFPRPGLWQMHEARAEWVSRPAKRRRRVLVVTTPSSRPMRPGYGPAPQPGAVGGEAARGEMVEADAVLEVSDSIHLGVAAMVGLFQRPGR